MYIYIYTYTGNKGEIYTFDSNTREPEKGFFSKIYDNKAVKEMERTPVEVEGGEVKGLGRFIHPFVR